MSALLGGLILSLCVLSMLSGTVYAVEDPSPRSALPQTGVPGKPQGLDEAGWASLQAVVHKSIGEQALLSADSVAGADGATNDQFGYSVALSGNTVLVGVSRDSVGGNDAQGSAYVYIRTGTDWIRQAKLVAGDGAAFDIFGYSVALSGDTALVGAISNSAGVNGGDQGSAYVFTRTGTLWTQQAKLAAGNGGGGDQFGYSVALSGDTALVGAAWDDVGASQDQGSAYVFVRTGTLWSQQAQLAAVDGAAGDQFGTSVALSGDTALVGGDRDSVAANSGQGSAYVFTRTGSSWAQQAQLVAGDGAAFDRFGHSVALSGDTALVGAYWDDVGANHDQGSAYVFTRTATSWTQQAQLVAGDGAWFGWSVALSGDTALVGVIGDAVGANLNQGSAHVFARMGTAWSEQAQLVAGDGAAADQFGSAVALSGDTALVGAPLDDVGANLSQGSAYVFTGMGASWTQQAQLFVANGAASDNFGWSVALSGDTALVGADRDDVGSNADQGSVYVYTRAGASWTLQAQLMAGNGAANDWFGHSVALSGDTALVGAIQDTGGANADQGSVYVFTRTGTAWTQQAQLVAGDGAVGDRFGCSVALSGDTALVGAYRNDVGANANQGSAYVFSRAGTLWTHQAKLLAADGASSDTFGYSVALSGDTALVGANGDDVGANFTQGSAYVFTRAGTLWTQQAKLLAADGAASDFFGYSVALSGDTALVGAYGHDVGANADGSAYVFTRAGTLWTQQARLVAADGSGSDDFGRSVAISGDRALVGALWDNVGANNAQGSAYVFARTDSAWAQVAQLVAGDGATSDHFGISVALADDTALVGASGRDGPPPYGNPNEGAAYVFVGVGLPAVDLEISKTDGSPYALPSGFVEYEILVGNAGPMAVQGARVQDPVPTGLDNALWTCAPVQGTTCPAAGGIGGIDELVDLPVNAVLRYVLSANVTAPLGGTITNTATVTVPAATIETDATDNTASDVDTVAMDGVFADGFESSSVVLSVPILDE